MTEEPKGADETKDGAKRDTARQRVKTRVTVRKFEGDDTSGEPYETVVREEEGYADLVKEIAKNAPHD